MTWRTYEHENTADDDHYEICDREDERERYERLLETTPPRVGPDSGGGSDRTDGRDIQAVK